MQGIIFVTWESYLAKRFGSTVFNSYRASVGETAVSAPLASHVYEDAILLQGVAVATKLTGVSVTMLLREYGRYFITNSLTNHLCVYLLSSVHSGRDLLLTMREAHAQLHRSAHALTPPLFSYEAISNNPNELALIYDSSRQLCPVLYGAIEGAAELFGETVRIVESTCMKQGAHACRFEIAFYANHQQPKKKEAQEMYQLRRSQMDVANMVLEILPSYEGMTALEVQITLQKEKPDLHKLRLSTTLETLRQLQYAGLITSSISSPGEDLMKHRYWRAPTV
ncbi:MAG TPA: heme NO-binding domain-containing protein [Ktedonobacteraceae bacterium]|jgi:predicted hydrocarbon binding protein|nr:heme NO-binding domain-containing protein [Ktedonobacteraceae bacterium]